jgi:hypothetical protein
MAWLILTTMGYLSVIKPHPWYHSLDTKYFAYHRNFGVGFIISFTRKSMPNKKSASFFSKGGV